MNIHTKQRQTIISKICKKAELDREYGTNSKKQKTPQIHNPLTPTYTLHALHPHLQTTNPNSTKTSRTHHTRRNNDILPTNRRICRRRVSESKNRTNQRKIDLIFLHFCKNKS